MAAFFDYFYGLSRTLREKRAYRQMMARVNALPEDYRYVFKRIQRHMWMFSSGAWQDMMAVHTDLVDLFEAGAAEGKPVLAITGQDVAAFCDELLRNAHTYTEDWREALNRDIGSYFNKGV